MERYKAKGNWGKYLLGLMIAAAVGLYGINTVYAETTTQKPGANPPGPKGGPGQGNEGNQGRFQEFLEKHPEAAEKMDLNDDGTVVKFERKEAHKKWVESHKQGGQGIYEERPFAQYLEQHPEIRDKADANDDGVIDEVERKQAWETMKENRQERREEWQEHQQERRENFRENHPRFMEKADINGDGTLDETEKQQARKVIQENWQERNEERRAEKFDQIDKNDDGKIGRVEKNQAQQAWDKKHDNNPPGMKGGPGTNWENPRGPQGGPGASPDHKGQGQGRGLALGKDRDNNPPGMKGGAGTNWENPAGPKGGAGASPNRPGPKKQ